MSEKQRAAAFVLSVWIELLPVESDPRLRDSRLDHAKVANAGTSTGGMEHPVVQIEHLREGQIPHR